MMMSQSSPLFLYTTIQEEIAGKGSKHFKYDKKILYIKKLCFYFIKFEITIDNGRHFEMLSVFEPKK